MAETPQEVTIDPQRLVLKLRNELAEATFQRIALQTVVDQLMEERNTESASGAAESSS